MQLSFKTESKEFDSAVQEYRIIWEEEGEKILKVFERVTTRSFQQEGIDVIVYEGPSFSGSINKPMMLRASYPKDVKKATLIHELGHRLIEPLHVSIEGIDEHQTLNLFLYDVWVDLYGIDFANAMVSVERERKGLYDYDFAWNWFTTLTKERRRSLWVQILKLNS